jgi:hypothetical protein
LLFEGTAIRITPPLYFWRRFEKVVQ